MLARFPIVTLILFACVSSALADIPIVDTWKFNRRQPPKRWMQPDFDDSRWVEGPGGFGTPDTPGSRVGTYWDSNDIWLRKTIEVTEVPQKPALLIHHDEDAEVYLNGTQIAKLSGYITEYRVVPIDAKHHDAIKKGANVLAVHCRQTGGGQFIDVHLVDADNVPELPPAERNTTPFQSELITKWGADVTPDNAWTEYPRPQMERDNWTNLNGHWQYAVTEDSVTEIPKEWMGQILVPFSPESKLSGVQRLIEPDEALWYTRDFPVTQNAKDKRLLLNFEAVDYRCEVFVNGTSVGEHVGGHTPFALDITDHVQTGSNTLTVRVEDDTEAWQLNGKQTLNPRGIWYTQVTGIWQTVWMESVPQQYIEDLTIRTDASEGTITVNVETVGEAAAKVVVTVYDGDHEIVGNSSDGEITLKVKSPQLWSPDSPHLYPLTVSLIDDVGETIDTVKSYAGIRTVGKTQDAEGHWRFTLNGETIFHWGPLDQGWWPDGLLTPPSDKGMLFDIEYLKAAGFNMIRKHIKVEPRRYYYHCDRLGMMVWQDQVSAGHNPPWTRMQPHPQDADWPDQYHNQYMVELERMIDNLESHPSIVVWVPFNEAWGQHRTMEVGEWTVKRDPSRLVNVASGGNFWPVGDIADHHSYPHPDFPFDQDRFGDFILVVGEFGGHGYPVREHLWDANRRNWGYGGLPQNEAEYKQRYVTSIEKLLELKQQGIAAGVYTQTTDVEGEINGLMTYDRKVIKIPAKDLANLHERVTGH
ncbi:MAG: hypothetical protein KDA80_06865 [Planctomycetaceae bacterium]|nr:hypothetical protein [Planctomycetaceae bacterium]